MTKKCHIVVGGGSSGIMLCQKLLERDDVILIERGPSILETLRASHDFKVLSDPSLWYSARLTKAAVLNISTPQKHLYNQKILYQQGYGQGGTSNVNAMILTGGHRLVFDLFWPKSWNSEVMNRLLYEVKGLLNPQLNVTTAWTNCFDDHHTACDDSLLDNVSIRSKYYQCCQDNCRIILEEVLLKSSKGKGRLKILRGNVERIRFEENIAVGITYRDFESNQLVNISTVSEGEVIVCAGVFESARIIHQSLRDAKLSEKKSSNSIDDANLLPSLGLLYDHVHIPMICIGKWSKCLGRKSYPNNFATNGVHGWIYLDETGNIYDSSTTSTPPKLQLVLLDGSVLPGMIPEICLPAFDPSHSIFSWVYMILIRPWMYIVLTIVSKLWLVQYLCSFVFGFLVCNIQPYSIGRLSFKSSSSDQVLYDMDLNFLSDPRDKDILIRGYDAARAALMMMKKSGLGYLDLGVPKWLLDPYIRYAAQTYFHACGTCRMSGDPSKGVVDDELRVHCYKRLRIADASVIPKIPTGPISAVCMAIGLRAGELILSSEQ